MCYPGEYLGLGTLINYNSAQVLEASDSLKLLSIYFDLCADATNFASSSSSPAKPSMSSAKQIVVSIPCSKLTTTVEPTAQRKSHWESRKDCFRAKKKKEKSTDNKTQSTNQRQHADQISQPFVVLVVYFVGQPFILWKMDKFDWNGFRFHSTKLNTTLQHKWLLSNLHIIRYVSDSSISWERLVFYKKLNKTCEVKTLS